MSDVPSTNGVKNYASYAWIKDKELKMNAIVF